MAELKMTEPFKTALEKFFNSPVNVHEAGDGANIGSIEGRPFLKALPDGRTVYLQKTPKTKGKKNYVVSLDKPVKDSSLESDTENSKFLNEMETRFRKTKPGNKLIIIDPDIVRGREAADESQKRSMLKTFVHYLQGRMDKDGVARAIPLKLEDYAELMEASVQGNSPLSLSVPVKGLGQYSIVISSQADAPTHDMFTSIPGSQIRMDQEGITKEQVRGMILYHELGHALDVRNNVSRSSNFADAILKRHRTECVADAHAVLQLAREFGDTKCAKLASDIRIDNSVQGFAYVMQALKQMQGGASEEEGLMNINGFKLRDNYEGQNFFASPELKDFIKQKGKMSGKKAKAPKEAAPKQKGISPEEFIQSVENSAQIMQVLNVLGSIAAYTTSPTADATVKVAEEKLADGSLKKMSDKEVHELAEKMVDENAFSRDQLTNLMVGVLMGQPTQELMTIVQRGEQGAANFPEDEKAKQEQAMAAMGMPMPKPQLKQEEVAEILGWRRDLIGKIAESGGNREAIVSEVSKEKDTVRANGDNLVREYKLAIMNSEFLEGSETASSKSRTMNTVRETLRTMEAPKVEVSGAKALGKFISSEAEILASAENSINLAKSRDVANLAPEAFAKAITEESKNLNKVIAAEKESQTLAFAIRKDPEAWKIAQTSPALAQRIEEKAKQKHPEFIEDIHLNLGNNDRFRLETLNKVVAGNKKFLAHASLASQEVAATLEDKTKAELSGLVSAPKKEAPRSKIKYAPKKAIKEASPEDIQWNMIKKNLGKGK